MIEPQIGNTGVIKENIDETLFTLQLMCVMLVTFCEVWQIGGLDEIALILNFAVAAVLAVSAIMKKSDSRAVYLWLSIVLISMFSVLFTIEEKINFEYIKTWLMFMITISLYFWVSVVNVTKKMIKRFFTAGVLVALLFVVTYLAGKAYNSSNPYVIYANFGLTNTNLAGIYLLNIFLCIIIFVDFLDRKRLRTVFYCLSGILFYFIYLTQSRACLIAAVACLLLKLFGFKKYNSKMTFIVVLFPLIFVIVYMWMIDTNIIEIFEFAAGTGKKLDSRVSIWTRLINTIRHNVLFGNYRQEHGNGHNIYLSVLASYGTIVFTILIVFLNSIVNKIGISINEKYQYMALCAFYAVIISGSFEAALFTGSQGMYVFSGGFLMVAKYVNKKSEGLIGDI